MAADAHRLRFPIDLDDDAVTALLSGWAADLSPGGVLRAPHAVVLEVRASHDRIEHLLNPGSARRRVLHRLQATVPSLRVEDAEPHDQVGLGSAVELRLSTIHRPLRTDRSSERSAALLHALTDLHGSEQVIVQWVLSGARTPTPARRMRAAEHRGGVLRPMPGTWHRDVDAVREERAKQSEAQLLAAVRVGAKASSQKRRRQLITAVVRALQAAHAPGVRLQIRAFTNRQVVSRLTQRRVPGTGWPMTLNAAELAGLLGWPIDNPSVPGLDVGAARLLRPTHSQAAVTKRAGVVLGNQGERDLVLPDSVRVRHVHAVGPTGAGKSTLLANMVAQDMARGHAVIVVDPKNDLVADVLDLIPEHRLDDVIVLDPADEVRPVGFNPLTQVGRSADLVVDQVVSVMHDLFRASWGPRTDDILRASLLTLIQASSTGEQYTLAEIPSLLTDPAFRRPLTAAVGDPLTLGPFWAWYERLSPAEQASAIGPVMNKLRAFLLRSSLRNMLGQADPAWNVESAMTERKILLVPLSAGQIGDDAAHLLGSLLVARIWQAAQARTSLPSGRRRPVMVVLDEFQNLIRLTNKVGDLLAAARGLGVSLTLAHQHLGQLTPDVQADVLANAATRVVFRTTLKDAGVLAKEMPPLTPSDLQHLPSFETFTQLPTETGAAPSPVSLTTAPPAFPVSDGEAVRAQSAERWGQPVEQITEQLLARRSTGTSWHGEVQIGDEPDTDTLGGEEVA